MGVFYKNGRGVVTAMVLALVTGCGMLNAQAKGAAPTAGGQVANPDKAARAEQTKSAAAAVKSGEAQDVQTAASHDGVLVDSVVAVVNGEVVLESDVEEERRLSVLEPISSPTGQFTRAKAIERLINRSLLLQQAKLQPQPPITEEAVTKQIDQLRKEAPACKVAHCETEAGWTKFLTAHDLTQEEVQVHWRQRMEALQFIEVRFRSGIRISHAEIKDYYDKTLLPQYAERKVKAPPLDSLADRIQEVLLQQQVSGLLADWLKSLRAQGTVQVVADGAGPV